MSSPTRQQLETLADFLMDNPEIAKEDLHCTGIAKQIIKRKWDDISSSLNALGGAQKDGDGWAKYWEDKKSTLKAICGQHAVSIKQSGDGTADNMQELSTLDSKFIEVMAGIELTVADSQFLVTPFPSTSQSADQIVEEHFTVHTPQTTRKHMLLSPLLPSVQQDSEAQRDPTPSRDRSPVHGRGTAGNRRQRTKTRSRSLLNQERDRFMEIERQRIQAETTTARALSEGVQLLAQLLSAVDILSVAIRELGQNILLGLNNIAGALERRQ